MVCKFIVNCTSCNDEVNYTDQVLRDILVKGIYDPELDPLGESNQDLEVFQFIQAKEAGKRSATKIKEYQGASSIRSQYRKLKNDCPTNPSYPVKQTCTFCGKTGHRQNPPLEKRKTTCPAYNKKCNYCSRPHHTKDVYRVGENNISRKGGEQCSLQQPKGPLNNEDSIQFLP